MPSKSYAEKTGKVGAEEVEGGVLETGEPVSGDAGVAGVAGVAGEKS